MTRAAAFASALVVALAACGGGGAVETTTTTTAAPPPPTTTTTTAPATTTTVGLTPIEQEALDRVAAFVTAVNAGDLDAIEESVGVPFSVGDRRSWEFHAMLNAAGTEWHQGECEVIDSADWFVNLECPFTYTMPAFVAVGASEAVAPYAFINGELRVHQWQSLGTDFTFALNAMVRYLQMLDPPAYEPCDPAAQTEDFTEHGGIARVPECAEVLVEHMDDIVAWIEAGEPDL